MVLETDEPNREIFSSKLFLCFCYTLVFFCGIWLRLSFVNRAIRSDEADTFLSFASGSLWNSVSNYAIPNNHILNSLLINCAVRIFGADPWAIRLPALLAGIALIPLTYLAMRHLIGNLAALWTATLVCLSPAMIDFSVNGRGYTLAAALFQLQLWQATQFRESPKSFSVPIFAVLGALGMWAVPTYLFGLGSLWLFVAWEALRPGAQGFNVNCVKLLACFVLTAVFTATLYSPVIFASGLSSLTHNSFVEPKLALNIYERLALVPRDFTLLLNWGSPQFSYAVFIALSLVSLFIAFRIYPRFAALLIGCLICVAVLVVLKQRIPPQRTWILLLPLGYALFCIGISTIFQRLLKHQLINFVPVLFSGVALLIPYTRLLQFSNQTGRALGSALVANEITALGAEAPRYIFSLLAYGAPLEYYLRRNGVADNFVVLTHHKALPDDVEFSEISLALVVGKVSYSVPKLREHFKKIKFPDGGLCLRQLGGHGEVYLYLLSFNDCPAGKLPLEQSIGRKFNKVRG